MFHKIADNNFYFLIFTYVQLRKKISSATSAIKSVFGKDGSQDGSVSMILLDLLLISIYQVLHGKC